MNKNIIKEQKILIYNFKVLNSLLTKTLFYKEIFSYYYRNLSLYNNLRDTYLNKLSGGINNYTNDRKLKLKKNIDNQPLLDNIKQYMNYNLLLKKKDIYLDSGDIVYNISLNNLYFFVKKYYEYNIDELNLFRLESELSFDIQCKRYIKIDFIKKSIKIFSKLLIKKGNYNNVYNIMKFIILELKFKKMNLYNFFISIFDKLYIPISLYAKKVAGRKLLVPNPNNLNFIKRKLWHSARIIVKSLSSRKETKLRDRLLAELMDIYNNKGVSIKKKIDILNTIKENEMNMRYIKSKK